MAPPRLDGEKVGVFSTRSPHRPNPIGLSLGKVEAVTGSTVHISGLDLLDGTPVLDIKPLIPAFDLPSAEQLRVPSWLLETQDPARDITVSFSDEASAQLRELEPELIAFRSAAEAAACIAEMLHCDPRSVWVKPHPHLSSALLRAARKPELRARAWSRGAPQRTACAAQFLTGSATPAGLPIGLRGARSYRKKRCAGEDYPFCLDALHIICRFGSDQTVVVNRIERLADTPFAAGSAALPQLSPPIASVSDQ